MKVIIFSIRDRASDQFDNPVFFNSVGQAVRAFGDGINKADDKNPFYMHPGDFDLYQIGIFDTDDGSIESVKARQVAVGKDLKIRE